MLEISGRCIIDRIDQSDLFFYIMRAFGNIPLMIEPPGTFELMDHLSDEIAMSDRPFFYFNDLAIHRSELQDITFLEQVFDFYEIHYRDLNGDEKNSAQNVLLEEMIYW